MTQPSKQQQDAFRASLARLDLPVLTGWAEVLGVAHPEMLVAKRAYGLGLSAARAASYLRRILENEYAAGNPLLFDSVAAGPPVSPDGEAFWTYFGAAGPGGTRPGRTVRPASLDELLQDVAAWLKGPQPRIRVVGGRHSVSAVAVPPHGALLVDLFNLGRLDPGPGGTALGDADEDVVDQSASDLAAAALVTDWNASATPDGARVARLLAGQAQGARLLRVPAGIKLRQLNAILWANGLALANMGNFAEQSVWGAATTGTHGSGWGLGPISASVVSFDVVIAEIDAVGQHFARVVRVEPAEGPTHAADFAAHPARVGWTLVQDDALFYAARVSMGCMGAVFAATVRALPRYTLEEDHTPKSMWESHLGKHAQVEPKAVFGDPALTGRMRDLATGGVGPNGQGPVDRHRTWLINPHARVAAPDRGKHAAVLLRRYAPREEDVRDLSGPVPALLRNLHRRGPTAMWRRVEPDHGKPQGARDLIGFALRVLAGRNVWRGRSYRILTGGNSYFTVGTACEIAVPLEMAIPATRRVLEIAADCAAQQPPTWATAPIALRFVDACDDRLSPHHRRCWGRDVERFCSIEVLCVLDPFRADAAFQHYLGQVVETLCTPEYCGRPHWGLYHAPFLTGDVRTRLLAAWGPTAVADWQAALLRFNGTGVFDNGFLAALRLRPT